MPSKSTSALLLVVAVLLEALVLVSVSTPGMRLMLGLFALVAVILTASALDLTQKLAEATGLEPRVRRYTALRSSVDAFLDEVRRLNWLAVDGDLGFDSEEHVAEEIEGCRRRMEARLDEIVRTAGKAAPVEGEEVPASSPPAEDPREPERESGEDGDDEDAARPSEGETA